jgi:subtilisin family serine protease
LRRVVLFLGVLALVGAAVGPVAAKPVDSAGSSERITKGGLFIVQMADLPVVAYDGSIKGLAATKPAPGTKIDPTSAKVVKYVSYLKGQHNAALTRAGGGDKVYDYAYSYNGFLAKLTAGQANRLSQDAKVIAVTPDQTYEVDTSSTPAFLGLTDPNGLWAQLGGPTGNKNKTSGAGDGVIVGVIDSGIWPESGSFSDRNAAGQLVYTQISGFHGKCDSAERVIDENWDANKCNKKLVAAQHFNAAWGGDAALEAERPWEFQSPRDYNGHGTHTSSTSAGNYNVTTTGPAAAFGNVSGIAPRARVAMYKALWSTEAGDTASGRGGDLVAAIDQAVADGVDVINYSISGTTSNFADASEIAFLFAANAGIFVSASAGNSGPTTGTVAHPSPWITTVAAGTHNRDGQGSVTLGNNVTYSGASVATATGPHPLIDATAAGLTGANAGHLELCYGATDGDVVLDPAKVAGKIVICKRGVTARVNKSKAVQEAGGLGMIMYNDPDSSLNADFHFVPTVHVNKADGLAIKAYAATAGATATINNATIVYNAAAPFTASFSSRGPLTAGGGDLLKPDVIAPGQDILAAVSPTPPNAGRDFNLYSGTSMSAPHVAGLAALLKDAHPTWSPMAVKSALMTSANDVLDGPNTNPLVIFRQGAGHVRPNKATDPGLVFDSGWNEWLAFLCGNSSAVGAGTCNALVGAGYSTDASNMNTASIAIGDLAGIQTVTRKVRNVGSAAATYTPSVTGMTGITTEVLPASLALSPGQTGTFTVKFTRTTAALNAYTGGQLTWSDGSHSVRIPLVVRPVALAAPATQTATAGADNGSLNWNVTVGYDGQLDADAFGVAPDAKSVGEVVVQDTDQDPETDPFDESKGVQVYDYTIAAGTSYFAAGTMESTTESGSDLDVYLLFDSTNNGFTFSDLVASSADGDSEEIVQRIHPAAGNYRLIVHGWGTPDGATTFDLHSWLVGPATTADGGTLTAAPAGGDNVAVTTGQTLQINASYSGLSTPGQYRGIVDYFNGAPAHLGHTVVIINR